MLGDLFLSVFSVIFFCNVDIYLKCRDESKFRQFTQNLMVLQGHELLED